MTGKKMGIYNFQPRFVSPIKSGRKTQTIRSIRKYPDRVGSMLHLYSGLRLRRPALLLLRSPCVRIQTIAIGADLEVYVDGVRLHRKQRNDLAVRDGFDSFFEMMDFWTGRLPFVGNIIHWSPDNSAQWDVVQTYRKPRKNRRKTAPPARP